MTEQDEFDVTVEEGGFFAIIPEWVVYEEISDRAVRLYAVLRRHANTRLMSRPSRAKLAEKMRTSLSSVDRALRELEAVGAVTVRHRWTNGKGDYVFAKTAEYQTPAPSAYLLHNSPAVARTKGGLFTGDHTPLVTSDHTVSSPVTTPLSSPVKGGVSSPVTDEPEPIEPEKRVGPSADHTAESKTPRKRPATRLPADWQPSDHHRALCAQRGIDVDAEARKFRLHAEERDRRCVVWNSAFSRWLENARPMYRAAAGGAESGRAWQE